MLKKRRSTLSKFVSLLIVFTIALQVTTNHSNIAFAMESESVTTQDIKNGSSEGDTLKVVIDGVENVKEADIALGDIVANDYTGYTFINATVDNVEIASIGKYNDNYYYSTSEVDSAYLLGSNKVVLHYQKNIDTFNINYVYQNDLINVVGEKSAKEGDSISFRLEILNDLYQVTSVRNGKTDLVKDINGFYKIENIKSDLDITITTEVITKHKINLDNRFSGNINLNLTTEVAKNGSDWTLIGTSSKLFKTTLNSIVVNDQYLNVKTDETRETTLANGTQISVVSKSEYNWWSVGDDYWYEIYVKNANEDLNFVPSKYTKPNISFLEIKGTNVYHWTGSTLESIPKGAMLAKNNSTDVFFVDTQAGYEANIDINGEGTKIIEKINSASDVKNVPGGYAEAKKAALANGCDYVFYYSDDQINNRQASITSTLINYDVKYDLNEGTSTTKIEDTNKYSILNGQNIVKVNSLVPNRDDYTFTGWKLIGTDKTYYANNEVVIDEALSNKLSDNTLKFEAQWVKNTDVKTSSYTIKHYFEQDNKEYKEDQLMRTVVVNAPVNKNAIAIPKNNIENYGFDATVAENKLSGTVTNDGKLELKVYYSIQRNTVTYKTDGAASGDAPEDKDNPYKVNSTVRVLANTGNLVGSYGNDKSDAFVCWSTDKDKSKDYLFPNETFKINSNTVLYPVFVGDLKNASTLTFKAGANGTISGKTEFVVPENVAFERVLTSVNLLPKAKANDLYVFDGWYFGDTKQASTNDELYEEVKNWSQSSTLEARFIEDSNLKHDISYTVNYYYGDTLSEAKNSKVKDSKKIEDLNVTQVTKKLAIRNLDLDNNYFEGYDFAEVSPNGIKNGDKVSDKTIINVYYVKNAERWTQVTFNAGTNGTLNEGLDSFTSNDVLIGETFKSQKINVPTIHANEFWLVADQPWDIEVNDNTKITKGLVINAQYDEDRNKDEITDKDQYVSITFNAGDFGNYDGQNSNVLEKLLPGDTVVIPQLTVDTGYTFTEYDNAVIDTIPTGLSQNLVYTAQYIVTPVAPVTPPTPTIPNVVPPVVPIPALVPALVPPTVVTPTPPTQENVAIEDNQTPKSDGEKIENNKTPLSKIDNNWALFNLLFTVMSVLLAGFVIFSKNKDEEDNTSTTSTGRILKLVSGLVAIGSILVFILTQDMSLTMVIFDKWTLFTAALFVTQFVLMAFVKNFKKFHEDTTQQA